MAGTKKLLEPANRDELLRGWLMHAHKARDRHGLAARRAERNRYLVGVPAIVLAAIAGTSIFASIGASPGIAAVIVVGAISVSAAVLTALQTFLDYPGRAARHHAAAATYKACIHELEQLLTGPLDPALVTDATITDLRKRLDQLEESSPVVAGADFDRVERDYAGATFVGRAMDLAAPEESKTTDAGR